MTMTDKRTYQRDYKRRKRLEAKMFADPAERLRMEMLSEINRIGRRDFATAEAMWHGMASWMEYPVYAANH